MTTNAAARYASVVFLKIQDFARRSVSEQTRLRAQLEAVVAVTTAELPIASRIVLDAADGIAVAVLGDPAGALRIAERSLAANSAGLPLCVGINHGAVQMAGDRADDGMIGDGIAVAASIADFSSPSRLLISRSFRDAMADAAPGLEAALSPAGTFNDAGLRTHELFSPDAGAPARRRRRFIAIAVATAIALPAAGVAVRVSAEGHRKVLDGIAGKYRNASARAEQYLRGLLDSVPWPKRS
jgi:class 3 adenylate cyclase